MTQEINCNTAVAPVLVSDQADDLIVAQAVQYFALAPGKGGGVYPPLSRLLPELFKEPRKGFPGGVAQYHMKRIVRRSHD